MKLSAQPYKGTRDYYPAEKAVQNYIFETWRKAVTLFGYQEYGTPLLEPLEVYAAKSGDELANEQTYAFTDRGDRTVAIRPEMTPSVSRIVAARRQELAYPARLFSVANFMRYERPQRGREREFWQLNVDMFGGEGVAADAEIVALADTLVRAFGADDSMYEIRINNRVLINVVMREYLELDVAQSTAMMKLLDRMHKIPGDVFTQQASEICEGDLLKINKLQQVLDAGTINQLPEAVRMQPAALDLQALFDTIASLGVTTARFDMTLMRGLDYYTGTVFEVFDLHPDNNRSMFGGGRYDGLVGMFGVEPMSAVGFAPGLTTTELFLRSHNLLPNITVGPQVYVVPIGDNLTAALQIAAQVRAHGITAEVDITDRKIDKQVKAAHKKQARAVLFVGDEEVASQQFTVKYLETGQESVVSPQDFHTLAN